MVIPFRNTHGITGELYTHTHFFSPTVVYRYFLTFAVAVAVLYSTFCLHMREKSVAIGTSKHGSKSKKANDGNSHHHHHHHRQSQKDKHGRVVL